MRRTRRFGLVFTFAASAAVFAQQAPTFDRRDLSGDWERTTPIVSFSNVPGGGGERPEEAPFTPAGKEAFAANKPGYGPRATVEGRNDPLARCEPLGLVRNLNVEIIPPHSTFEIVQSATRMLQFFEYRHDWREVWTDGRSLPAASDIDPRWNGYSVGRWQDDTFVVESIGLDGRSWLDKFGYPHSEEMRVEERYRRVDADTLELVVTITDPVMYTKPFASDRKIYKLNRARAKRWDEQIYCVPSEEFSHNELIRYYGK